MMNRLVSPVAIAEQVEFGGAARVQGQLLPQRRADAGHPVGVRGDGAIESLERVVHGRHDQRNRINQRAVEIKKHGAKRAGHDES